MDDLKRVTLASLRELARKHLGPGHSKLNKSELIAALARFIPALKKLAQPEAKAPSPTAKPSREPRDKETRAVDKKKQAEKKASERKPEPEQKAPEKKAPGKKAAAKKAPESKAVAKKAPESKAAAKKAPEKKPAAARRAGPKAGEFSPSVRPAQVVNFPPRPRFFRSAEEAWQEDAAEMVVEAPELEQVFQQAAEPLVEGFFVARMMGERELRRHHLTEEQALHPNVNGDTAGPGYEENLGELPLDYGNDLALALARDPHTLFITWDFSPGLLARASEGFEAPRAMLRVFDGDRLVREEEISLESRSFYIHGLMPGRPYRVEAHFTGRDGRSRRIGGSTRPISLPRTGPSPDTSVRFIRVPPPPVVATQAAPLPEELEAGPSRGGASPEEPHEEAEEREYILWRRIPLPGSDEGVESSEARRVRTARQERGEGGPLEHLEISSRPPGSSEQSAGRREPASGGASGQTHWTPPPSGRGR